MIAAQLLAYYFTELKDDRIKKLLVWLDFQLHKDRVVIFPKPWE